MEQTLRETKGAYHQISERKLYDVEETAFLLNVSRTVVYELLGLGPENHGLASVRINSRRLIPAAAIDDFVKRLQADQIRD